MSKYLLDTHALIWYRVGNKAFKAVHRQLIENNDIYVSMVSLWEVALLLQKNKLATSLSAEEYLNSLVQPSFTLLNLKISQFSTANELPEHHKDPFDRILIAQAIENDLTLLTQDAIIPKYPVKTAW